MILVLRAVASEAQAKLPVSSLVKRLIEMSRFLSIGCFSSPECPVLLVATPGPEGVDPLGSELGHRRGASQLELPLLPEQTRLVKIWSFHGF